MADYSILEADGRGGYVLLVRVEKSAEVHQTADCTVYVRKGAQSLPIKDQQRILDLQFAKGAVSFEDQLVRNAPTEEVSEGAELQRFLSEYSPKSDALEFAFPAGPCVAFLFNPFGATVMRRLLAAMAKSFAKRPGELDLLYVNNEQEWVLEAQVRDGRAGFVRQFLGQVPRSRADAIADYRIMANQPEGEYASSNWEDCSIWRFVG